MHTVAGVFMFDPFYSFFFLTHRNSSFYSCNHTLFAQYTSLYIFHFQKHVLGVLYYSQSKVNLPTTSTNIREANEGEEPCSPPYVKSHMFTIVLPLVIAIRR